MGRTFLFVGFFILSWFQRTAAQDSAKQKIAVFAPLYLDSAFNDTAGYRYAKNVFPKFISSGLEFYEGVQLALDSLNREKIPLEVFIYDTRSSKVSIADQLNKAINDSVKLIIAHCATSDVRQFADSGLSHQIPVINVNLPNDAGVTSNPYYVMLNPTLHTQCESIYKYIQKHHSLDRVVVFRKKGQLEDRIKQYFEDIGKSTMSIPLKMKWVELTDSFSINQLRMHLDTTELTLCMAGSLDENFGKRMVQHLAALNKQSYLSTIMGMPTWDAIPFNKTEFKGVDVVFSNPFYNTKLDKVSLSISAYFKETLYARPSDMVYRGYEVMWKYAKLLLQHGADLSSNLSSKLYRVFTDYDIQPVINRQTTSLDYFENKKLYFIKWQDGLIRSVY